MKKIAIFNWKLNPLSFKEAAALFRRTRSGAERARGNAEVAIAPPFVYLEALSKLKDRESAVALGAQDVFWENKGAFTGEISPEMLKNSGAKFVIVGHSERRRLGETDEIVNKKALAALKTGLKVVLCVGESLSVRRRGRKAVEKFVGNQLVAGLKGLSKTRSQTSRIIVAYEPIWAIGTGRADTPKNALEMVKFIKDVANSKLRVSNPRVLYGGSVSGKNAADFVKYREINGVLVGGASLKAAEIKSIIKACQTKR